MLVAVQREWLPKLCAIAFVVYVAVFPIWEFYIKYNAIIAGCGFTNLASRQKLMNIWVG